MTHLRSFPRLRHTGVWAVMLTLVVVAGQSAARAEPSAGGGLSIVGSFQSGASFEYGATCDSSVPNITSVPEADYPGHWDLPEQGVWSTRVDDIGLYNDGGSWSTHGDLALCGYYDTSPLWLNGACRLADGNEGHGWVDNGREFRLRLFDAAWSSPTSIGNQLVIVRGHYQVYSADGPLDSWGAFVMPLVLNSSTCNALVGLATLHLTPLSEEP